MPTLCIKLRLVICTRFVRRPAPSIRTIMRNCKLPSLPVSSTGYNFLLTQQGEQEYNLPVFLVTFLGLIPGPIAYGNIIDDTCLIWEQSCSGGWTCWQYDNYTLSYLTVALGVGIRFGSIIFMFLAMITYRSSASEKKKPVETDTTVSSEQKRPVSITSEVGVQANFPSGKTKMKGSLEMTDL